MNSIDERVQRKLRPFTSESYEKKVILTVSDNNISALNKSIEKKIRQNEAERNASLEVASKYIVGGKN